MADDLELLDAWRAGDRAAGNALFHLHFPAIRRFFRNKLPATAVEDAIQRTFLACVEGRDRFRGDSTFRTYLFGVARFQLYRELRTRTTDLVAAGLDGGVTSLHDLGISPSSAMARDDDQRHVLLALQRLPIEQQILLELYYWEDVPGPELARMLDVPEATVRTRLFRARARLRREVETLAGRGVEAAQLEQTIRGFDD